MTDLALRERALAAEAIARGDALVAICADDPPPPGARFWLAPEHGADDGASVARAWQAELGKLEAARHADGSLDLRCLCELHEAHRLGGAVGARLARARPYVREPVMPGGWALVVRARCLTEPAALPPADGIPSAGGWFELASGPDESGLLDALTDEAFELHLAHALGA